MTRYTTVGALKRHLEGISNDAILVVSAYDHGYRSIGLPSVVEAEQAGYDYLCEYYGPEHMNDQKNKVVNVLLF